MIRSHPIARRAFALVELLAITVVLILIAALMLVAGTRSRRLANLGQDINKLHDIAAATGWYAADFKDQVWALSWKARVQYNSAWPELNFAASDREAQSNQAVEILRRRAGRTDIPRIFGWIPQILYSHLPLADYLGGPLPWLPAVSSADADRLRWASDPACFAANCFAPCQPDGFGGEARWAYSASFQVTPATWDRSLAPFRVEQAGGANNFYNAFPDSHMGPPQFAQVVYPSDKVHMFDEYARHFGNETAVYFAHPEAKLPLLFFDGHAQLKKTRDANPGWLPNHPESPLPTFMLAFIRTGHCTPGVGSTYQSTPDIQAPGVFKWTRAGLDGRDFGPEVGVPPPLADQPALKSQPKGETSTP